MTLTRLPSFFVSILDWDESLYFLMAEQWRAGHLPYTAIWDNKPVGIYAIFAAFQMLCGDRLAAMRIAAVAVISVTAFVVRRIALIITRDRGAGMFAGVAYIICSLSNDGLAANTEPFMAAFTAAAVLVALSEGPALRVALLAGLLAGAAFMVKYVAIFEDPAILLLILLRHRRAQAPVLTLAVLAAAALPLGLTAGLYWRAGQLPLWWDASVASNFRRAHKAVTQTALVDAAQLEMLRWGPLYAAGLVMLGSALPILKRLGPLGRDEQNNLFLAIWLLGGCIGVVAAKSFFDHYFLQLLPVLCVSAAWVMRRLPRPRPLWLGALFGLAVLALPALAAATAWRDALGPVLSFRDGHPELHPDVPAQIAADIRPVLAASPGAAIYVFDDQPIIYSLAHETPPTRFAFPSILTTGFLANVAGVDAVAEVARILATCPLFIIRRTQPPIGTNPLNLAVYAEMNSALAAHYRLWRAYPGSNVYILNK